MAGAGSERTAQHRIYQAFGCGLVIGSLGGLIGLGGAEFRLPLLIGLFGFAALEAVILNKVLSLLVVTFALFSRSGEIPFQEMTAHWQVVANVLAGSLIGAWVGADLATRLRAGLFYRLIAILLVLLAAVLFFGHGASGQADPLFTGWVQIAAMAGAGVMIGLVASLLGVAGGELIIPTLVLLAGLDVKLAGSLSLAISLPTMIVGMARYSLDSSFHVLRAVPSFLLAMGAGSIVGAVAGGMALGVVPASVLLPALSAILLISAIKIWRHRDDA